MSTAFAADNELAEKQSSTCRSGSILSMIGYCLGYQNEPEVTKAPRAVVAEEVIPVTIIPKIDPSLVEFLNEVAALPKPGFTFYRDASDIRHHFNIAEFDIKSSYYLKGSIAVGSGSYYDNALLDVRTLRLVHR